MDTTRAAAARRQENLVGLLAQSVRRTGRGPRSRTGKAAGLTYGQVADEIMLLHEVFRICRVGRGDKIALLGRNSASWAVVWLAAVTYGAVIVPILPDFRPDDVHHIVNHSDAALLFVADALFAPLDPAQLHDVEAVFSLTDFRALHCRKESLARSLADVLSRPGTRAAERSAARRFQIAPSRTSRSRRSSTRRGRPASPRA